MGVDELLGPGERSAVETILSNATGRDVRLEAVHQVRPDDGRVLRVRATDRSWIVKRPGSRDEDRLYGPWGFFAEWVAAATVTATSVGVGPDFLGGDAEEMLMVFDDVGPGRDVSQVLRGNDPIAAADALVAMGSSLGRMHAATASPDIEERYRLGWEALCGPRPVPSIVLPAPTLLGSLDEALGRAGTAFRFSGPDLVDLQSWAMERGDGWSMIHGDPCLDNWILDPLGHPKLIDFQGATFAPAALDAAYARAPFPTCWCLRRLPVDVIDRFEDAHRTALASAGSPLGDEALHRRHLTFATAWWFLGQILWRIGAASSPEPARPGEHLGFRLVPPRDMILLRLDSFVDLSAATGVLSSLADQARVLRAELRHKWPEPDVDLYPAFGGSSV